MANGTYRDSLALYVGVFMPESTTDEFEHVINFVVRSTADLITGAHDLLPILFDVFLART